MCPPVDNAAVLTVNYWQSDDCRVEDLASEASDDRNVASRRQVCDSLASCGAAWLISLNALLPLMDPTSFQARSNARSFSYHIPASETISITHTFAGTRVKKKAPEGNSEDLWDLFLSYRVAAEAKLVEEMYWRLQGLEVVLANGTSRRLRVFWDRECLRSGESWEAGFCHALCRTSLVVLIMSRKSFTHVPDLKPDSPCDNVILEHRLALALVLCMRLPATFRVF